MNAKLIAWLGLVIVMQPSRPAQRTDRPEPPPQPAPTAKDGRFITWREHRIDDEGLTGLAIRGGDGLAVGDLDRDGHPDVVSVHEDSDHIRIAFGTAQPNTWINATLAEGRTARAAEDVTLGDVNGDGRIDAVFACEKGHLLCCQAPPDARDMTAWECIRPAPSLGRGSWIRVKLADMDGDGRLDILAANKGRTSFSVFYLDGPAIDPAAWKETVLGTTNTPINLMPIDLDRDGDLDAVAGSRGDKKVVWFENLRAGREWREHLIHGGMPVITGFMMQFLDINRDGRPDVVTAAEPGRMVWLEQPAGLRGAWPVHVIGSIAPDSVTGIELLDINGDGRLDAFTGGYSDGPRLTEPKDLNPQAECGRLVWFEQPVDPGKPWIRHDLSRRRRGMFDCFVQLDVNRDGLMDLVGTRGNSGVYDGVFWLEQGRSPVPAAHFERARAQDSPEIPIPDGG